MDELERMLQEVIHDR